MLFLVVCWSVVAGLSGILNDFVALSITSKRKDTLLATNPNSIDNLAIKIPSNNSKMNTATKNNESATKLLILNP
mgnify:CR=1 FL=1